MTEANVCKRRFRSDLKEKLQALSSEQKEIKSKQIAAHLRSFFASDLFTSHPLFQSDFILGAFAPMSDEPYWPSLLREGAPVRLAFPVELPGQGQMGFAECGYEELVLARRFGVELLAPPAGAPLVKPQIYLVPGLGFTSAGARIGRGRGFYDRYLNANPGMKIGLCFSEQLACEIPVDEWDQRMDFIITEENIYQTRDGSGS